jgi:hypothetical protein
MKHTFYMRYSHVSTYFSIARQSYENAQRYSRQLSALPYPPDEDVIFDSDQLGKKEYNEVVIYVIFAALTAEALINKYLFLQRESGKISKKLFDHIDEKMSTEDKWGLATQYFNSPETQMLLDYGCEPMQSLKNLLKLRNKLVHAKQSKLDVATYSSDESLTLQHKSKKPDPYNLAFENTKHYLETVKRLMEVLQKLDSESISDWLNADDWVEPVFTIEE